MELPIFEDNDADHCSRLVPTAPSPPPPHPPPPSAASSASGVPPADPPRRKAFHPKRSHKKSRMGCQNCKARKVKCDEARPSCQTCVLRKETCVYVAPLKHKPSQKSPPASIRSHTSRTSRASRTSHTSRASPTSPTPSPSCSDATLDRSSLVPVSVVHEPVVSLPGCDSLDMKIIWHFMVNTCSSFASGRGGPQDVMRVHVMKHAFDVRFLFRSVLALSCLHARTVTGEDLGDVARHHFYQNESLHEYRLAIEAAEPRTFGALLANSLLVTATSSENFRVPMAPDLYILQWLLVWRGIGTILDRIHRNHLSTTGLTLLFHRPSMDLKEAAKHIPQHLTRLILSIQPQDCDFLHKATYVHGLKYLGSLYQHLRQDGLSPVMRLRIISWFTYLPTGMVELFRERRERALVILAHYAVFLKLTISAWWLVGVGDRSLRDIIRHLGPAWHPELDVPLRAMNMADPPELARMLLDDPFWEVEPPSDTLQRQGHQNEANELCLVDDEGRPIRILREAGTIVLADPSEPGEEPVWNLDA